MGKRSKRNISCIAGFTETRKQVACKINYMQSVRKRKGLARKKLYKTTNKPGSWVKLQGFCAKNNFIIDLLKNSEIFREEKNLDFWVEKYYIISVYLSLCLGGSAPFFGENRQNTENQRSFSGYGMKGYVWCEARSTALPEAKEAAKPPKAAELAVREG